MNETRPVFFMAKAEGGDSWNYKRLQDRAISEINQSRDCCQCGEESTHTLTFGKGINEIKVRVCKSCLKNFKNMLDKEFGETFWGFMKAIFGKDKVVEKIRTIPVSGCNE